MPGSTANRQAFIQGGIAEGMSGAGILRELRDAGLGMRTQDFYNYYRNLAGQPARDISLATMDRFSVPPFDATTLMLTTKQSGYGYVVEFTTQDRATGEIGSRLLTVRTDELMSLADAESTAFDAYNANPDYTEGTTLLGYSTHSILQFEIGA
jgi:hypothetical protein